MRFQFTVRVCHWDFNLPSSKKYFNLPSRIHHLIMICRSNNHIYRPWFHTVIFNLPKSIEFRNFNLLSEISIYRGYQFTFLQFQLTIWNRSHCLFHLNLPLCSISSIALCFWTEIEIAEHFRMVNWNYRAVNWNYTTFWKAWDEKCAGGVKYKS